MEDDGSSKLFIATHPAEISDDDDDSSEPGADDSNLIYVLNLVLSGTARLNVLLPTATILAFTIFAPLLTNDGDCSAANRWLTAAFLLLCAASCAFFAVTDSYRTASGSLHYGVATLRGMWTFSSRRKGPAEPARYRLRWPDLFHALMSVVAFVTFAGSHRDVVGCFYPEVPRKVINTAPLVVGFAVSVLFVVFLTRRRGIGYPFGCVCL
ncbi:hypothetical protein AXF42_Ash016300 [Apostasia shenzhenica]|uniref:Uncharacterized protein n=1 Tax=Apostasia shenzhenica TaxID=1088818 RepID=A0A2H9ZXD9_9ASPA|nr:hypothetical protein AXF42_Ash016300 [Apostasia shenzhenica]